SFCVVPFTRGRERSRDAKSIVSEVKELSENGYKEVTLLGQNVDSYKFKTETEEINFANLLEMVALVDPNIRVRFSTSHPKDITNEVLHTIAKYENICNYIHLPAQSGNSRVLKLMNRTYDREWYLNRIDAIRSIIPDCAISSDMITGFCTETEDEHKETLTMMEYVKYDLAYNFKYSERPGTLAAKKYEDDIDEETKSRRLTEIIRLQQQHSHYRLKQQMGKVQRVLVEGNSKKSADDLCGRNDHNNMVIFPKLDGIKVGDYVNVKTETCTSATLMGSAIV
ncbi:MAG: tRNA-2-methylthio-N6-dimethylallyladenosine synthase, partial [Sphingobacteriales bacterium]